jgi:dynein heavy chain 1
MPPSSGLDNSGEGRHGVFVREFASAVAIFQDRTDALIDMFDEILGNIDDLAKCAYTADALGGILARIQKTVRALRGSCRFCLMWAPHRSTD